MLDTPSFSHFKRVKGTSKAIIDVLSDGEEWNPSALRRELARRGVKKSYHAVYMALKRLVGKGIVRKVRRGWYQLILTQPTHGVGIDSSGSSVLPTQVTSKLESASNKLVADSWTRNFGHPDLPRIHDLWLVAESLPIRVRSTKKTLQIGRTEIKITVGEKRQKITVVISNNDPGLDYDGFEAVIEIVKRELLELVGWFDASAFQVKNVHFNIDIQGLRLDGVKSVTLEAFDDWLARIYQKNEQKARLEVVRSDGNLAQIAAILQGGFTGAQALTYIASLHSQFQEVAKSLQHLLEQNKQFLRFQQAVLSKLGGVS